MLIYYLEILADLQKVIGSNGRRAHSLHSTINGREGGAAVPPALAQPYRNSSSSSSSPPAGSSGGPFPFTLRPRCAANRQNDLSSAIQGHLPGRWP